MRTPSERNVDAETRAVEEGHHAWLLRGGAVKVVSDTRPGKWYWVTFYGVESFAVFACQPQGEDAGEQDHGPRRGEAGIVCCKHAAVAARRLEREGFLRLDDVGRWRLTDRVPEVERAPQPDDPFEGFG